MAEILIRLKDNFRKGHPASGMAYRRGTPVTVQPDGHPWGRLEGLPNFAIVKMPKLSVSEVDNIVDSEFSTSGNVTTITRRRKFTLLIDDIDSNLRNKLETSGSIVAEDKNNRADVSFSGLRNSIKDTKDNTTWDKRQSGR